MLTQICAINFYRQNKTVEIFELHFLTPVLSPSCYGILPDTGSLKLLKDCNLRDMNCIPVRVCPCERRIRRTVWMWSVCVFSLPFVVERDGRGRFMRKLFPEIRVVGAFVGKQHERQPVVDTHKYGGCAGQ